jgi:hypothetical protein
MPDYVLINPNSSASVVTKSVQVVSATNTNVVSIIVPLSKNRNLSSSTEFDEEQEWESIVRKPHVRNALRRLAAEVLQQDAAGETEEGGFAIE